MKDIYFFVDSREDAQRLFVEFCLRYSINILTTSEKLKFELNEQCELLPRDVFGFKYSLSQKNIKLLLLPADNYHFKYNYLARKYTSVVLQQNILTSNCDIVLKLISKRRNYLFYIYKFIGLSTLFCDKEVVSYETNILSFFKNIINVVLWRHQDVSSMYGYFAKKVFISSIYSQELYIKSGIDSTKLLNTGTLQEDNIVKNNKTFTKITEKFDILFILQPFGTDASYYDFDYLGKVKKYLLANKQYKIALKLHPRSKLEDFEYCNDLKNVEVFDFNNEESPTLLKYSKVVVGTYSSYLLYPLYYKIPVIFLDFPEIKLIDSLKDELKLYAKSIDELNSTIEYALDENNYDEIVENQNKFLLKFGFFDGKSHERIYNEIVKYYNEIKGTFEK